MFLLLFLTIRKWIYVFFRKSQADTPLLYISLNKDMQKFRNFFKCHRDFRVPQVKKHWTEKGAGTALSCLIYDDTPCHVTSQNILGWVRVSRTQPEPRKNWIIYVTFPATFCGVSFYNFPNVNRNIMLSAGKNWPGNCSLPKTAIEKRFSTSEAQVPAFSKFIFASFQDFLEIL